MALDNGRLQHIFPKAPEGFRELTPEEQAKLDELALKQGLLRERLGRLDQQVRAAESEIRATKLEKENTVRALRELNREASEWNQAHGVVDVQKDRVIKDGVVYIRNKEETQQS